MHNGHKVLEITEGESLKNENITIEYSKNDFDVNIQKLDNIKKINRKRNE